MTQPCEESPTIIRLATAGDGPVESAVIARVPQGIETAINVRILPERTLDPEIRLRGCQPRQGAPRRDVDTVPLPPDLSDKLKNVDKVVIAWLAKDAANATAFIEDPVEALAKAGVGLERSELKALARAHRMVRDAAVMPPGTVVTGLTVEAVKKGKVGDRRPTPTTPGKTPDC